MRQRETGQEQPAAWKYREVTWIVHNRNGFLINRCSCTDKQDSCLQVLTNQKPNGFWIFNSCNMHIYSSRDFSRHLAISQSAQRVWNTSPYQIAGIQAPVGKAGLTVFLTVGVLGSETVLVYKIGSSFKKGVKFVGMKAKGDCAITQLI